MRRPSGCHATISPARRRGRARPALAAAVALAWLIGPAAAQTGAPGDDPVARGRYLAAAADCMPCHTAPGGVPYAGGRAIRTPFGTVVSPNITPDPATGIGGWTDDQFWRALHDGLGRGGEDLYPVMPYTSYTLMAREDALAIKAYLDSLGPVTAPQQPNDLVFPFNIRATLGFWRELYFRPGAFRPDPARSPEWNRGAYLATALGHCGECHTPRNRLGATEPALALTGAVVDGWFAPNITSDPLRGVGDWPVDRLAAFLRTGADAGKGTAFGPMQEVVHNSLSRLAEADLRALAVYLSGAPAPPNPTAARPRREAADPRAAALYLENCGGCHQPHGRGIAGAVPPLAGNPAVLAAQPNDVAQAVLNGLPAQGAYGAMPSFAAALDDAQVAALANYVRGAWADGAGGSPATPALVAELRAGAAVAAAGTEAARRLCPAVSPVGAPDAMAPLLPGASALMRGADTGDLANRTDVLLRTVRRANPGIGGALLVDTLIAAYCPTLANDPDLSWDEKQDRFARFRAGLERALASGPPPGAPVLVSTVLPPDALARAEAAARAAGKTLDAWLADAAAAHAGGGPAAAPAAPR